MPKMLILDFDRICRLCLNKGEKMVPIFESGSGLSDRIESCTCLKLANSDGLPGILCMDCLSKLNLIKDFRDQCERSDSVLRKYLQSKDRDDDEGEVFYDNGARSQENGQERARGRNGGNKRVRASERLKQTSIASSLDGSDWNQSEGCVSDNGTKYLLLKEKSVSTDKLEDGNNQHTQSHSGTNRPKILPFNNSFSNSMHNHNDENDDSSEDSEYEWPGSLSDEEFDPSNSSGITEKAENRDCSSSDETKMKGKKSYECEFCGRTFSRSNHLAQHELTHTKEKPFQCSYCQKGFWYKNSLIGHIKQTHTGDVNYTCEECGRGFFQRSEFMRHKPIHSNETPFKCDECDMTFKLMKNLRRHQKVHTGTRTHTCQYCGKSFRMLQTLRVHLILHTGEKPYKCTHCGRGFSQSAPLKAHIRMHTGERPYVCNVCGEAFPTGNALKSHGFKHTGIHPNSCKDCSVLFKRKRDLVDHWNKVHGGAVTDPVQVPPQLPPQDMKIMSYPLESTPNLLQQQSSPSQQISQPSLPPPPRPIHPAAHFCGVQQHMMGGSIETLCNDNDPLSSDPLSHHQMLQNQLPSVLEMSNPVSPHLISPSLMKSPSESEELITPDDLSFV